MHSFLKKGEGKLVSNNHGITKFAIKRKEKIISKQKYKEDDWKNKEIIRLNKIINNLCN
tara:strand:- start:407 stop:583 length:177 start_codon:yes stop_codon:yes gene_type:complete